MASAAVRSAPPTPPPTSSTPVERGEPVKPGKSILPKLSPVPERSESKSKNHPNNSSSDFLPLELLVALKRQPHEEVTPTKDKDIASPKGALSKLKRPDSVWKHAARRNRLQHIIEAPPCVCGSGKDISFLYDNTSPQETQVQPKKYVPSHSIIPEEYHIVKHPGVLGLEIHDEKFKVSPQNHQEHLTLFPSLKPTSRFEAIALKRTLDKMLERAGIPAELTDEDLKGPTQMHKLLDLVHKEQTIYNIIFHELVRQVSIQCVERGELLAQLRSKYAQLLERIPRQIKSLYNDMVAQKALDKKLNNELRKFKSKISLLTSELNLVKEHDEHVTRESRKAEENLSAAIMSSEKNAELLHEYHGLYELQRYRLEDQVQSLTSERDMWQEAAYSLSKRIVIELQLRSLQKLQLCEKNWCKLSKHFAIMLSSKDTKQVSEVQALVQEWQEKIKDFTQKMNDDEMKMREKLQRVHDGICKWIKISDESLSSDGSVNVPSLSTVEALSNEIKVWQDIIGTESEQFSGDTLVAKQDEVKYLTSLMEKWNDICFQIFSRHEQSSNSKDGLDGKTREVSKLMKKQSKVMQGILQGLDAKLLEFKSRIGGENGIATGFVYLITPLETWDSKLTIFLSNADSTSRSFSESEWIKLGKIFHDWKEKLEDVTTCIGQVKSTDESISTKSTKRKGQNVRTTGGPTSAKAPYFSQANKRAKDTKTPDTVENKLKVNENAQEDDMKDKQKEGEKTVSDENGEGKDDNKDEGEEEEDKEYRAMTLEELVVELEAWYYDLSYSLDGVDSSLTEEVSELHADMVEWMIRLLLVITKTKAQNMNEIFQEKSMEEKEEVNEDNIEQEEEAEKDKQPMLEFEYHTDLESLATLRENYNPLADKITHFTQRITKCCGVLVQELANERTQEGYPNPDEDVLDLARLDEEKNEWVSYSKLLLDKVFEGDSSDLIKFQDEQAKKSGSSIAGVALKAGGKEDGGASKKTEDESRVASEINIIGEDQNIHLKSVDQVIEEGENVPQATSSQLGLSTEKEMPEGRGSSSADAEKLLISLDETKNLLSEQEDKTREVEEKLSAKEDELQLAKTKIESLEAELKEAKRALNQQQQQKKSAKPLSRGNSRQTTRRGSLTPGKK